MTFTIGNKQLCFSPTRVYDPELGRFQGRDVLPDAVKLITATPGDALGIFSYTQLEGVIEGAAGFGRPLRYIEFSKPSDWHLGALNLYTYALCAPPMRVDPTGLWDFGWKEVRKHFRDWMDWWKDYFKNNGIRLGSGNCFPRLIGGIGKAIPSASSWTCQDLADKCLARGGTCYKAFEKRISIPVLSGFTRTGKPRVRRSSDEFWETTIIACACSCPPGGGGRRGPKDPPGLRIDSPTPEQILTFIAGLLLLIASRGQARTPAIASVLPFGGGDSRTPFEMLEDSWKEDDVMKIRDIPQAGTFEERREKRREEAQKRKFEREHPGSQVSRSGNDIYVRPPGAPGRIAF